MGSLSNRGKDELIRILAALRENDVLSEYFINSYCSNSFSNSSESDKIPCQDAIP